ncbi:hypothetical protein NDU88_004699 [Pleurodeles waltl]|uniref:L1 transposable element RRM domain-containing protein n=1 Tax=Pleurodeles waltl TaxID=8319 RepID=A0AAV7T8N9_PLEWA|nr:hypothetical protein NDU88_004699 [Pleurodeles waltl]
MAGKSKSAKNQERTAPGPVPNDQQQILTLQSLESTLQSHSVQFKKVLQAIMDIKSSLELKIDTVSQDLNLLRVDHRNLTERVKTMDDTLSKTSPMVSDKQKQIQRLDAEVKMLWRRAEEAESRSRRNNIRFVVFPEHPPEQSSELTIEQWLIKEVLSWSPSKFFSVERAHRVQRRTPLPGQPPRPSIVRLLNYGDRDLILQQFCSKGPFRHEGSVVHAYPDFTQKVQKQRNSYMKIKQRLREHNIKYALLFPAKLRVISEERTHMFTSPEDTCTWMHAKGIAQTNEGVNEEEEWMSSTSRKRNKRRHKGQPTERQAAEERAKVLKETPLLIQNSFETLRSGPLAGSDSESASSDSTITDALRGPDVTPRTADEL